MILDGKRVLVTGSSQGIGRAIAEAMLTAGARVVLTAQQPLTEVSGWPGLQQRFPGRCHYFSADFARPNAAGPLVEAAWTALGGINVLVNNVGTFREPNFLELTEADFEFLFRLNVWSAISTTREVVKRAKAAERGGRILFTSSLNGTRSEPAHTLYDASKGAIDALTRQLAVELAPLGFTTATVAPGLVETPLTDFGLKSLPAERNQILEQIPLRRIATVADVAGWFVFLASDAARYATGIVIPVDGGLDAQQMGFRPVTPAERSELGTVTTADTSPSAKIH